MKIGLIDVDGHHYPNLALMKLSAFHKAAGDDVEWWKVQASHYDLVYMSKIFSDQYSPDMPTPWNAEKVVRGGTGYAIRLEGGKEVYHKELDPDIPTEVEHIYPDYSIYPEFTKDTAYGFLTRGCPRACEFCHVAPKEGRCSVKVADLSEFWRGQKHIILNDPNLLACKDAPDLLRQLVESKATVELNQGIDARLITPEKAELLASMKLVNLHFAMDTMEAMISVARGLKLFTDAYKATGRKWSFRKAKVFMLTNFNTTLDQDMERIRSIQEADCWPYVMIYNKPSAPKIIRRLQRWTNNTILYLKYRDSFDRFCAEMYKTAA